MPIWAPPWAILNLDLPGCSFEYFCASSDTSGYEAVAPEIVIVVAAEAAAGAATPSAPATASAAERRRMRFMCGSSVSVGRGGRLTFRGCEHTIMSIE